MEPTQPQANEVKAPELPALPPTIPVEQASIPSTPVVKSKPTKRTLLLFAGLIALIVILGGLVAVLVMNQNSNANGTSSSSLSSTSSSISTTQSSAASSQASGNCSISGLPVGWQQQQDSLTKICFALPPQDSYQAVEADIEEFDPSGTKQWYFESKTYTEGGQPFTDQASYANLAIVRSPGRNHLSNWACDGYCAEQNVVSVSVADDSQTLDQVMAKFEQKITSTNDPYFDGTLQISGKQKIQKWGLDVYNFKITGGQSSDEEAYYLVSNGKQVFYVSYLPYVVDVDSTLVLDSLVLPQ